jgi:hypothetical protein
MKNYVYIFHVDTPVAPSAEQNAAWGTWFTSIGDKMVDGGNPFAPASQAEVKNGAVTMDSDTTSGYTIVKAENLEEAVTLAMGCPLATAPGCSVSVYETMPM